MTGVETAMRLVGSGSSEKREKDDFYATTPAAAQSIFDVLRGGVEPLSMNGRGGMIAYGWFVWEIGYTGAPTLHWLEGEPCK